MAYYDSPDLVGFVQRNAMLDVAPLSNAIEGWKKQQQQDIENQRAAEQLGMQRERLGMEKQKFASDDAQRLADRASRMGELYLNEKDPHRRVAIGQAMLRLHPDMSRKLQEAGVDINNHENIARFFKAGGSHYDPTGENVKQAQINQMNAQAAAANRREEPDIVRTLRAAGVDPRSEKGQQFILNSIKGGDPLSQLMVDTLKALQPQPKPAAPVSPIRPQSYAPEADANPMLIQTQAVQPAPAAPPRQQEQTVDTPFGPMPRSKARLFGLGLAMQGRGEAGKMFSDPANPANMGKEGVNAVEKEIIGRVQDLGELTDIKSQFDPRFLDLGNRVKQAGVGVQAWLNAKGVKPEDRADYERYTQFRAATTERLNNRIKLMSGTAVSGAEEQRMLRANPNAGTGIFDGDDPISFEAKLNNSIKMQKLAIARFNYLRSKGINETEIGQLARDGKIEGVVGLEGMTKIMNQRGAELEQELRQSNPQANDLAIRGAVKQQLKQEFGI